MGLLLIGMLVVVGGLSGGSTSESQTDSLPDGYDSTRVAELLPEIRGSETSTAIVVVSRDDALSVADVAWLQSTVGGLQLEGAQVTNPQPVPSPDGTVAFMTLELAAGNDGEESNKLVADIRDALEGDPPAGLEVGVTGPAAISADISQVFDGANVTLLATTASVVALLLIVTYRSPFLWLIPLFVVALADRAAAVLGSQASTLVNLPLDPSGEGILSVLVFGAGTDYALLLISRYREELAHEENRRTAMTRAVQGVTEPILSSGTTVVLSMLTLLLSVIPSTRGLGVAAAVGIVVAMIAGLVVLPAILVLFGRWVFWPRVPQVQAADAAADDHGIWGRVAAAVVRRPRRVLAVALTALIALASGALGVSVGLSSSETFLDTPESVKVADRLAESFPAGASQPLTVLAPVASIGQVVAIAENVGGVESVIPGEDDGRTALISIVASGAPGSEEARGTIKDLRDGLDELGDDVWLGGSQVEDLDGAVAAARDARVIVPAVLLAVGLVLLLLLRSVVAALVLLASVLLTWASALGLSWWIFTRLLDMSALDQMVPLYSFLFLVALGVDFSIFLVSRAKEETEARGTVPAMVHALARTGGVITSAGILLAAVFLTLGVLPVIALAQVGTIVCVGVLLDTLVVRTVVVPAVAAVLGDRFWWPTKVGRREPIEPAKVSEEPVS